MTPYFERTDVDRKFYDTYLRNRLPSKIFDIHVHLNLKEHVANVTQERLLSDWALECGHILPADDAYRCVAELYPGIEYRIAGFPWPIKEADIKANNSYLAEEKRKGKLDPFMSVRPEWDPEYIESVLLNGEFVGFKPYPDMVSGVKGADISIYDFIPPEQLGILDRHKKALMLHIPRKERFADNDNVRELLEIRQKYPDIKIIIAHFGRSFCPYYLKQGLKKMKGAEGFYFDTTAVINPEVYDIAFSSIPVERILYGSDLPIFFWHGKRRWTEKQYINLCRGNYSWNKEHQPPEIEKEYTFFLYEQMKSILDSLEKNGMGEKEKNLIFYENALKIVK